MSPTSDQAVERVHQIIQGAVARAGGNWKQSFEKEVCQIFAVLVANMSDAIVDQKID